jgi:aryl-phospho-beta-D-glucosidase BglC (GH1 family)
MIFYNIYNILYEFHRGVVMQKRIKIIIGCLVAIVLLVGLAIFIKRGDASPNADTVEANATEKEANPPQTVENKPTLKEGIITNGSNASNDDTDTPVTDKDDVTDNVATIDATVSLQEVNSWLSGDSTYIQVDATITNNSDDIIDDWVVSITLSSTSAINDSWNMNYELDNGNLTITGVDYNKSVQANSSVTFGMILMNPGDFDSGKATLSVSGTPIKTVTPTAPNNPEDSDIPTSPDAPVVTIDSTNKTAKPVPTSSTDDWLYTDGNKIIDKDGKEVWLTGVNWFGYNTGTNIFDGVWSSNLNTSLSEIADRGFNLLRIPFSSELILEWKKGEYPKANYNEHINSYLKGMNSLEIFDYVVGQCRANGIKIMIDIHSAETNAAGHIAPLWYTDKISETDYLSSLSWMANRYKNDDTIIAYDLKNEPHGAAGESNRAIWNDSKDSNNWKYISEKAALAVLSKNPNALVLVEGIQIYPKNIKTNKNYSSNNESDYFNTWWGGNLRGVKDFPVDLGKYQNKLVYSPHDYGPAVYAQPWFDKSFTYDSLYKDCWRDNWMYIHEDNIAPLLIGEWGGFMASPNLKWMTYLRDFIIENRLHHTFWCFNANSGDTGGLVLDDFTTWDEKKYEFVKEALWQKNGKFVGLDHKIPLGSNGITLKDY